MTDSLLPSNSTALELAAERILSERMSGLPLPIADLWNPDTCPPELLPFLAWSCSVDIWDDAWSETIKRRTIANSFRVHRHKGTVGAVRAALAGLGFDIDITEWFDGDGLPHTFLLDAFADDIFKAGLTVSPELLEMVSRIIAAVKPVRSHLQRLRIGERFTSKVYMRAGVRERVSQRGSLDPAPRPASAPAVIYIRTAQRSRLLSQMTHDVIRSAA